MTLLPNFQKPTVAVLCEPEKESWTGSLRVYRDSMDLFIFTLDLSSTSHPVLSHISSLPYDTIYTEPSQSLGGLVVFTTSALFHLDQSGRMVGLQVNGWPERITTNEDVLSLPAWQHAGDRDTSLDLADSQMIWIENIDVRIAADEQQGGSVQLPAGSALLVLKDRRVFSVRFELDGKTATSLSLESVDFASAADALQVPPSLVLSIPQVTESHANIFVGSMLGTSRLLQLDGRRIKDERPIRGASSRVQTAGMDVDLEDDADLYGDSTAMTEAGTERGLASTKIILKLTCIDSMPGLGPLGDATLAVLQDSETHEDILKTVAAHGVDPEGGLVHFEDRLQPRNRRPVVDATTGTMISSVEDIRRLSPGIFLVRSAEAATVYRINSDGEAFAEFSCTSDEHVIDAAWIKGDQYIVATSQVMILRSIGEGKSCTLASFANTKRVIHVSSLNHPASSSCQVMAAVHTDGDVTISVFHRLSTKDSTEEEVVIHTTNLNRASNKRYTHAMLFQDTTAVFEDPSEPKTANGQDTAATLHVHQEEEVDYGEEEEDPAMQEDTEQVRHSSAGDLDKSVRLALLTVAGCIEVWSIGKEPLILWRSNSIFDLPNQLEGLESEEPVITCSDTEGLHVQDFWVGVVGDELHIALVEECGHLMLWSANVLCTNGENQPTTGSNIRHAVFNKRLTKHLGSSDNDTAGLEAMVPPNGEPRRVLHQHFTAVQVDNAVGLDGPCLAITGSATAGLLCKTRRSRLNLFQTILHGVSAFADFAGETSRSYLVADQYGLAIADFPSTLNFDLGIASTSYTTGRQYTRIRTHPPTRCLVAASTVTTPFVQFDTEDGTQVRNLDLDPQFAFSKRGCLELFKHDWFEPIDGFEFEQNETVSALELLTLNSSSAPTGLKDFIGVGTTVYNGEDRPTRGSMYVFEVVEVVASRDDPEANCRLKLLVKDDGKGPVTALSDISGYFVVAIGQRMFVRAFEKQEALINVAFLDVGFLTTTIRRLGSTLLITDVKKACIFVGFQEEPFRLSVFARHFDYDCYVTTADYLVSANSMGFISADWRGVVRLLEYNANSADALAQRLTLRTEFQTCTEYSASLTRANTSAASAIANAEVAISNEIILCGANGSLALVRPIGSERLFQVGASISIQMMRNVRHAAALHPRGYRLVRNDAFSRPLYRGILDGLLLGEGEDRAWGNASRPKRQELVALAGGVGHNASQASGSAGERHEERSVLAQLADVFG